jgi:hypothetical protein
LAGASLLRRTATEADARYALCQSVREYALEKLRGSGKVAALEAAHTGYLLRLGDQAAQDVTGERQAAWLERLEAEHEDIRAALVRLFEAGDQTTAVRLSGAIWRFWPPTRIRPRMTSGLWPRRCWDRPGPRPRSAAPPRAGPWPARPGRARARSTIPPVSPRPTASWDGASEE